MMILKYIQSLMLLTLCLISLTIKSQVIISKPNEGEVEPGGILDLRSGKISDGDIQFGLVIPNADGTSAIKNPLGGNTAKGTFFFDKTDNCIKVFRDPNNWSGCLLNDHGVGSVTNETIGVGSTFPIKKASTFNYATIVISADGNNVYSAGYNYPYRTGFGRADGVIPSFTLFFAQPTRSISLSLNHGALVTETGLVYTWGYNLAANNSPTGQNQGGYSVLPSLAVPFNVNDNILIHGRPMEVVTGNSNSYVLTDTGKIFVTGSASNGANGNGSLTANLGTFNEIPFFSTLIPIANQISATTQWVGVANGTNTIYVWGANSNGQTGLGNTTGYTLAPTAVNLPTEISQVAAGIYCGIALSKDQKRIFVWGQRSSIGLGSGIQSTPIESYLPQPFNINIDKILHVEASRDTFGGLLVTTTAGVFATGVNYYGRLGTGDTNNISDGWKLVVNPNNHNFLESSIGLATSIFITGNQVSGEEKIYKTGLGVGNPYLRSLGAPYVSGVEKYITELFK